MGLPPPFLRAHAQEHSLLRHKEGRPCSRSPWPTTTTPAYEPGSPDAERPGRWKEAWSAPIVVPPLTLYDCCADHGWRCRMYRHHERDREDAYRQAACVPERTAQVCFGSVSANFPGANFADWNIRESRRRRAYATCEVKGPQYIRSPRPILLLHLRVIEVGKTSGFCAKGEGGAFCRLASDLRSGGKVPVNTDRRTPWLSAIPLEQPASGRALRS